MTRTHEAADVILSDRGVIQQAAGHHIPHKYLFIRHLSHRMSNCAEVFYTSEPPPAASTSSSSNKERRGKRAENSTPFLCVCVCPSALYIFIACRLQLGEQQSKFSSCLARNLLSWGKLQTPPAPFCNNIPAQQFPPAISFVCPKRPQIDSEGKRRNSPWKRWDEGHHHGRDTQHSLRRYV